MRHKTKYAFTSLVVASALALGFSAQASADTTTSIPAMAGIAQNPRLATQFLNGNGVITNTGPEAQWCVSLPTNHDSGADVSVWVSAPSAANAINCFTGSANQQGGGVYSDQSGSYFGRGTSLILTQYSPSNGNEWLCCNMGTGATVGAINYSM